MWEPDLKGFQKIGFNMDNLEVLPPFSFPILLSSTDPLDSYIRGPDIHRDYLNGEQRREVKLWPIDLHQVPGTRATRNRWP